MNTGARYLTEIHGVRELILRGEADAAFWSDHLRDERLYPWLVDGCAELTISATAMRWMAKSFRELTFALSVSELATGNTHDGFLLLYAVNSSRWLTFMERTIFQTPYRYGVLDVDVDARPRFSWQAAGATIVDARMGCLARTSRTDDQWWEGSIVLPHGAQRSPFSLRFNARLGGPTATIPFTTPDDSFILGPAPATGIVRQLVDSGFRPTEWRVRRSAVHARSRTYSSDTSAQ